MTNLETVITANKDLPIVYKNKIATLKKQHWNYSMESQFEWMHDNLRDDDLHVMLFEKGDLIGYLNMVYIEAVIDDKKSDCLGIGNVCVERSKQGHGHGKEIMRAANQELIKRNAVGFLLCHKNMTEFYETTGWAALQCNHAYVSAYEYKNVVMCFNLPVEDIDTIKFSRNF